MEAGPTVDELTALNAIPTIEPIQAYAGPDFADGTSVTTEVATRKLHRTGKLQCAVATSYLDRVDQRG
ncbi:hypothetical protein [Mycobacterium leprae]|uniref:hypothetical protein n=1 Tax=Mycobacterium leprae TaxID=1769 RepID=UPI0002F90A27|nr:hypothetical protein [Mycobacterium leprae]OAR19911.1 hypothetical protein A8144_12975 [Mycobacterium leprae 3125609]OAX70104.1 hypothetical protein A3216_13990 [Mycobacterium leprae 7935681]